MRSDGGVAKEFRQEKEREEKERRRGEAEDEGAKAGGNEGER